MQATPRLHDDSRRSPGTRLDFVLQSCRAIARQLAVRSLGQGMRLVRRLGSLPGFATAMIDVDTVRRENASVDDVRVRQWEHVEAPPEIQVIPGSDPVPPHPSVHTTVSLIDVRDRRYSLRNGYLVDPALRITYEHELIAGFPYRRLALKPLEHPESVDGVVACLRQEDNYGHWLTFALPLIDYYREVLGADPDYYYLGPTARSWQYESLEMLGIPASRTLTRAVTADRLLVAIADRRRASYDSHFLLWPDAHLNRRLDDGDVGTRRVFISRAGTRHRRIVNESACAAALEAAFGVELVVTEGMSLAEEIALFRQAELVVGALGAGLVNCVFAPTSSALVELSSTTFRYHHVSQIVAAKGQRYGLVRCPAVGARLGIEPSKHDFEVDVDRLVEVVGNALAPGVSARAPIATTTPSDGPELRT